MVTTNSTASSALETRPLEAPILAISGVGKSFPGVQALDAVTFELLPGEVHALCGENGAGKSTLMRILAGNQLPDRGTISIRGKVATFRSPLEAQRQGILLIHQELSLVPELTVAENIFLGHLPRRALARVDWKRLRACTKEVLGGIHDVIRPDDIVGNLSISQQQMVEIARAAAFKSSIVIFDEPTASLTDQESEALFGIIDGLRARGVGIIYITHKMKEVFRISDRITVLRDGQVRGTLTTSNTDEDEVVRLMIGRAFDGYFGSGRRRWGPELLRVEDMTVPGRVNQVSFAIREGEVLGLYGLVGAGRSDLAEAIFGMRPLSRGRVFWRGQEREIRDSADAMRLGIGLVPEDRKHQGLIMELSGLENVTLTQLRHLNVLGFMQRGREDAIFREYKEKLSISTTGPAQLVKTLSGGNQQKFVIAKWLATNPKLLILDEPTRGIDVGAKVEIHKLIAQLAAEGLAVLVISSEMPEIMGVSHRILTMFEGRLTGEFQGEAVKEDGLIAAVTGHVWAADEAPSHRPVSPSL
jgi:ribose transport system ATP-binding protein